MALVLGTIKGQQVEVKKVFFVNMFDMKEDNSIMYNRELTENAVQHLKNVYRLQIVGWFIESEFTDLVSSMHLIVSQYKQGQFVLLHGLLNSESKILELSCHIPLVNKNFNTCFGTFTQVPFKVQ